MEFYEDKGLDARFRSRLADFKDSGYDRGHMVGLQPHQSLASFLDLAALAASLHSCPACWR